MMWLLLILLRGVSAVARRVDQALADNGTRRCLLGARHEARTSMRR